jgi:CheY-like chemotaxis protein
MTESPLLTGLRVLVVEDEAMVAMMIEDMLSDLGCVVMDVAGTVSRGVALANDPELALDGAILDINLGGEKVYPVAVALAARRVPFIFSTGYSVAGVAEQFAHIPILAKPYERPALEHELISAFVAGEPKGG